MKFDYLEKGKEKGNWEWGQIGNPRDQMKQPHQWRGGTTVPEQLDLGTTQQL